MSETNVVKGYKMFNWDWTCKEKQYKVGETVTQDGELKLCRNGIHFCTKMEDCFRYYPVNPEFKMAEVEAIGDVLYSDEDSKCCTNRLRVVREISIQELLDDEEICLRIVKVNGWALIFVKNQTPEICLEAVKQDGRTLEYVEDQTPEICLEAVKQDEEALIYVKDQTPEICRAAIAKNPYTKIFIHIPI